MITTKQQNQIGTGPFTWLNKIGTYNPNLEGDIAAVKKLISARDLFLNKDLLSEERTKAIDDYDLTAGENTSCS